MTKILDTKGLKQIRRSFDKKTVKKIIKGALIAGTGAAAIYILEFIGEINVENPELASIISFVVPTTINAIKEYLKGE